MSFSRPLPSMGWNVPRALLGIILSAEGVFPSGFSFLVIGSHQASKLCLVGSPDWNSHPCLCGLPLPLQASCSHRFSPSLLQMSRVWNSSHPLSFIQVRLLSFGLRSWMTTLPVEAKMTSHGVRGPSWTEADCRGVLLLAWDAHSSADTHMPLCPWLVFVPSESFLGPIGLVDTFLLAQWISGRYMNFPKRLRGLSPLCCFSNVSGQFLHSIAKNWHPVRQGPCFAGV